MAKPSPSTFSPGGFGIDDADEVAVHVEQTSAGVAGVDLRIRLEQVVGRTVDYDVSVKRTDYTVRYRAAESSERISDSHNALSDNDLREIGNRCARKPFYVDLDDSDIGLGIACCQLSVILRAVLQRDLDLCRRRR